jgi:small subunit ribosomal protein S6
MRNYELTYIVHPDVADEQLPDVLKQVEGWVSAGGEVQKVNDWGRRRLAYPIQNQREGHYICLEIALNPTDIEELERNLKLSESILRYLLVRAED